ncbi:MAG: response regulator [Fuerstiella sp.]
MTSEAATRTTILLIDDSATDRIRGAGLIQKGRPDWEVVALSSVEEGLQEIARRRVDVVVSDLVMPGIDGRELLQIMNRDYPLTPVVLTTSQGNEQIAAECVGLGAVNYVPKRLLAENLVRVLQEVLTAEAEVIATRRVLQYVVRNRCSFEIDSDLEQVWSLVNFIRERLHAMQMFLPDRVQSISSAVREALLNAHFHGNLEVNSRPLELSRSEYIALASQRRHDPLLAGRQIRLSMCLKKGRLSFQISDDGRGFDVTALDGLTGAPEASLPNGNGIRQMRTLMSEVTYNDRGNEVTLTDVVEEPSV